MRLTSVAVALSFLAIGASAQTKVPVEPALFDDFVYYAHYVVGSSAQPCPKPPNGAEVQAYIDINSTDTQATLFRDDSRGEFVLAFPGTDGTRDILTNIAIIQVPYMPLSPKRCPGCLVHLGFYSSWASAANTVKSYLDAAFATYPDYSLVVTGGSLGAALSNFAFASLKTHPEYAVRAIFNYGQPRVGNQAYADHVDELAGASETEAGIFYRVTHADDGVTQLPPPELGFRHSSTEYWESEMVATATTTYRCFGQEPTDCNNSLDGFIINDAHTSYAGYTDVTCFDA